MGIDGDYFPRVGDMVHLATERDSALREGDFVLVVREKTPLGLLVEKRQRWPAKGYETNTNSTRKDGWMVSHRLMFFPWSNIEYVELDYRSNWHEEGMSNE